MIVDKIGSLWPEITLLFGAAVCIVLGLWPSLAMRRLVPWITGLALVAAGLQAAASHGFVAGWGAPSLAGFIKLAVVAMGLVLLLVATGLTENLSVNQEAESATSAGKFDATRVFRGEFYAFFLLSLVGVMLVAGADDLIWLFLALELTSLPTYVMVATTRDRLAAQEAAVKYFFLGAMSAAVFLYGFTLIYGATGYTDLTHIGLRIAELHRTGQPLPLLLIVGMVLAVTGISFKIAAVPMHFYAADVYQGAATPVTAFLAFVPKTAGFVAIIHLLNLIWYRWGELPPALTWLLVVIAAATMTVGNVLGLLQSNVKRILAYSSIAHSGYMLVGLVAMPLVLPGSPSDAVLGDGVAAVLFYLIAYGAATIGAFAVLGCLRARGEDAETLDDLSGLVHRQPGLAAIMLVSVLSLIGLPPLAGFMGKIYLFGSAISHSQNHPEFIWLVVIAVLNSAVSAVYYLRIAAACFFGAPGNAPGTPTVRAPGTSGRALGAGLAAVIAVGLGLFGGFLVRATHQAALPPPGTVVPSQASNGPMVPPPPLK